MQEQHTDLGVIIALKEEFREFFEFIRESCEHVKDEETGGTYYLFEHTTGSITYRCVATFAGEMGEKAAGRMTDRLISSYKPHTIAVVGIAGGIDKDVMLCDVVVANSIESYLDNGKAASTEDSSQDFSLLLSGEAYRTSQHIKSAADHLEFTNDEKFRQWQATCEQDLASDAAAKHVEIDEKLVRTSPSLLCGHIASGPIVGASPAFTQFLKTHDRNYLALEMESGGVLAAIYDRKVPQNSVVIRGISDFGDDRKSQLDGQGKGIFRRAAMRNATRLLYSLMDLNIISANSDNANQSGSQISHDINIDEDDDMPRICGFTTLIKSDPAETISEVITTLTDSFQFGWEPSSFQDGTPVVYWPVRLRQPTPIHAAQTFAAAAIQVLGGQVILCLDDLGTIEHTSNDFASTIKRWTRRIGVTDNFEVRKFSEIIGGEREFDAWPVIQKWLGYTQKRMTEILEISKIVESAEVGSAPISTLSNRRPRRLLTPAMVWTCLAQLQKEFEDRPIITLGGLDEKKLWRAWRQCIAQEDTHVGHLYNPRLSTSSGAVHMARVDLGWDSREDIENSLWKDIDNSTGDDDSWLDSTRILSWCLNACIALPDYVYSGCKSVYRFRREVNDKKEATIQDAVRLLEHRLLRPTS